MRKLTFFMALIASILCFGQAPVSTGSIAGRILDKDSNDEPLSFATVVVKGTTTGTTSDMDGLFLISNLAPGTYTIVASFVGYEPLEISGLVVEAGKSTEVTFSMGASETQLAEVVITAKAQTESEMTLLSLQRKSVDIQQAIGAQELSRKGVGDAESAVTKVAGVSKQDGAKNVYVRGLGDRYNSTSLNGLPLPSEDPEYKNISLSFFTTEIINNIEVNKTFGAGLYGDVGGANINIKSKELFDDKEFSISSSFGVNTQVLGQPFQRIDGTNYFGWSGFNTAPISSLQDYTFDNSYDAADVGSPANSSLSIQAGRRFDIGNKRLNILAIAGTESSFRYQEGITRSSLAVQGFGRDFRSERFIQNSRQNLMLNGSMEVSPTTVLTYNSLLTHTNNQSFGEYLGFAQNISEVDGTTAFLRRQQVNDNTLIVNQLAADVEFNDKLTLNTAIGYNIVNGNEPDRRLNTFQRQDASNTYEVGAGSAGLNHRFFSELEEREIVAKAEATYRLSANEDSNNALIVGYNFRNTDRDFKYRQFSFAVPGLRPEVEIDNVDGVFNQASLDNGTLEMVTNRGTFTNPAALDFDVYTGARVVHAGYVNFIYDLTPMFTANLGMRLESLNQEVFWDFNQDRPLFPGDNVTKIEKTYFLPSLNLKYNLDEDNILRLAASKSYTMPQFKEVAPFLYEDINFSSFGNPDLVPSDVVSVDIKYDRFFSRAELVSLGVFAKKVTNSINRILVESAATEMSYVNSGDAEILGAEVEVRKTVWTLSDQSRVDFGSNVSYLYTQQELRDTDADELQPRFTNTTSRLEGASPLLLNADLTFYKETERNSITSALIFASFSDRIYTIGTSGVNDIVEQFVPRLDWVNSVNINSKLKLGLSVKNILNPAIRQTSINPVSGDETLIQRYYDGVQFSIGLNYSI